MTHTLAASPQETSPRIILASSSAYRRQLLEQVNIRATCIAPDVDEKAKTGEEASALARRLAIAKATKIARHHSNAAVIGSDQVASLKGMNLGKPGDAATACQQLAAQSGQRVTFYTAVCVCLGEKILADTVVTHVDFRTLSQLEIEHYIHAEQPLDCAGSFKSEGLGISLFKAIHSEDPSALVGLPLIRTLDFLRQLGVNNLTP